MESLVKLSASDGHLVPAKVFLTWPSNDISKVSELLIWESLEMLLCSAQIPRESLNGGSLQSEGSQAFISYMLIIAPVNLDFAMLKIQHCE